MIQSYISMWKNFGNFKGRARRKDYWLACVMNIIIMIVFYGVMMAGAASMIQTGEPSGLMTVGSALVGIYGLAMFIPFLSLSVRRLHDTDKSGWFYLLGCLPVVNIVLLVFFATDGTQGTNRFGEDPKGR